MDNTDSNLITLIGHFCLINIKDKVVQLLSCIEVNLKNMGSGSVMYLMKIKPLNAKLQEVSFTFAFMNLESPYIQQACLLRVNNYNLIVSDIYMYMICDELFHIFPLQMTIVNLTI